jgi:hypothetical protein
MRYLVGLLVLILALPELVIRLVLTATWIPFVILLAIIGFWRPNDDVPMPGVKPDVCLKLAEKLLTP